MSIHDEALTLAASIAAHEAEDARLRALYVVDLSDRDATIADLHAQNLALQARVASLEAVTPQPPVVTPPVPAEPPTAPTVGVYGPTGKHYPTRTPKLGGPFAFVQEVDCNWAAIGKAIAAAAARNDTSVVWVRPGNLVGLGAGATSKPVLENLGRAGRSTRVVVAPRDGIESITFSGASSRFHNLKGITFIGFSPWGIGKTEDHAFGVVLTGCEDVAWAWSKVRFRNVTNSGTARTKDVEFIECVSPDSFLNNADRGAFRNADSGTLDGVLIEGCYDAPVQKPQGEGAHLDWLQTSGPGRFDNIVIRDSIGFAGSNQGLITTSTTTITLDHTLVVGGDSVYFRYPHLAGAYVNVYDGAPWPVNGEPERATIINDSHLYGTRKGWTKRTVDASSSLLGTVSLLELDVKAPKPTDAILRRIWTW